MAEKPRTPSIAISLLPVVTLVIMLAVAIYIFRGDSLGGASQIVLLIATSICSLIAVFHCKIKWEDIEEEIRLHDLQPIIDQGRHDPAYHPTAR